jgi:hypothetical protein
MEKQEQSKLGRRSISDRWIPFKIPERRRTVRSVSRQEERAEEEDRSRTLNKSAGSDCSWIKENLHIL